MGNRVLITGLNVISSLGLDLQTSWENLLAGQSGVKRITLFDPAGLQTQIAAQVPDSFETLAEGKIKKRLARQMTRVSRMCLVCAQEAIAKSGIQFETIDKSRVAVILGVVNTGNSSVEKDTDAKNRIIKGMNNSMAAWISIEYGLTGPSFTVSTACASSGYAIGLGYDMIKNGQVDIVIAGGADSIINPEEISGFNDLFALSVENDPPEKASRPFSKNRDGFVVGEGAGIMILESEASAKERNAEVYGELAGYAFTNEGYNIIAPQKDGEGMAQTMELALKRSGVDKSEIGYINAHGTSTTLNDKYETMAIKSVFGERAQQIPVSSNKSMIGHTIGAAGVIEGAFTVLSLRYDHLPPTINLDEPDPELDLDYVPNVSRLHQIKASISNSFAFGGHNVTLVFRKYLE
jgi:3-oxoacyl-[acyl-carrier-protein] synthase II